ncbi:MAG: transposase [Pseudomonadota bacterium]
MKRLEQNDQRLLAEVSSVAERMAVLEGPTGRRSWPDDEKGRIVMESFAPGARVCDVARRHGMTPQQLSTWRGLARKGKLALPETAETEAAFAVLAVDDTILRQSTGAIEIEAAGVVVRLAADTPATRIAEIAAALGKAQ